MKTKGTEKERIFPYHFDISGHYISPPHLVVIVCRAGSTILLGLKVTEAPSILSLKQDFALDGFETVLGRYLNRIFPS